MKDAERPFGRFALKVGDEIEFVVPDTGEFQGVVTEIAEQDAGAPVLAVYVPAFPCGKTVSVYPEEVTAKILYSNAGLYLFEIAEKVEYWDEDARRVLVGWVYEIDSANREVIIKARGRTFSRFPEELHIIPPPRLCDRQEASTENGCTAHILSEPEGGKRSAEQARRDGEEEKR